MKTIGIISDTHGTLPSLAFTAMEGCDLIIHAGDICDPDILCDLQTLAPVRAVLGNNDYDEYGPDVRRFANFEFEGLRFLVAHFPQHVKGGITTPRALMPGDPLPDVSIHGHTHLPALETEASARPAKFLICPGSVSRPRGGFPATVAKMEVENGRVLNAWIEDLQGIVLFRI